MSADDDTEIADVRIVRALRATTWFDGPIADLGRRRSHISPILLTPIEGADGCGTITDQSVLFDAQRGR